MIGDGTLDIINEAEIPGVIYKTFNELGLRNFVIRINNRKILNGFFEMLGLGDRAGEVMRTIDKLEKIGPDKVMAILTDDVGLTAEQAGDVLLLITCEERGIAPLDALAAYGGKNETFDAGVEELSTVVRYLSAFGVPDTHFKIDLTIARGLDYYTGTVYETTMTDHPEIGSICSGGRYDDLAGYYTDKKLPGVGISIGLTRLFFILEDQGYLNADLTPSPADVLVLPMTDDLSHAISFATELRAAGVRTQIYSEKKKFKAKMTYADRLHIPYVVFLGEDELAAGKVAVKDMATGEQMTLSPAMAAVAIKAAVEKMKKTAPIKEPKSH